MINLGTRSYQGSSIGLSVSLTVTQAANLVVVAFLWFMRPGPPKKRFIDREWSSLGDIAILLAKIVPVAQLDRAPVS